MLGVTTSAELTRLAEHFARGPYTFRSSPLYQAISPVVADDPELLTLLTERRTGQQPSFLLFGAVHDLLLSGAVHPLREFYPSVAGRAAPPDEAGPVFLDFCRVHRDELATLVRTRLVQTNVVKRVLGLRLALAAVRRRCDGPVHVIEVGTSAGLLLNVDRYRYVVRQPADDSAPGAAREAVFGDRSSAVTVETVWRGAGPPPELDDVPPIADRFGVDLNPIDATDPDERRWLRSLVWPEDGHKARLLSAALEITAADPPEVIAGDAVDVCPALGRRLPAGEPRVVFHAATRMHVPAERHVAFDAAIDAIGEHGPLFHVWQEPDFAQHHGMPIGDDDVLAMHGPGDTEPVRLMRVDGHLEWMAPTR